MNIQIKNFISEAQTCILSVVYIYFLLYMYIVLCLYRN